MILEIAWRQFQVVMFCLGLCTATYIVAIAFQPHLWIMKQAWLRYLRCERGWRGIWNDEDLRIPRGERNRVRRPRKPSEKVGVHV